MGSKNVVIAAGKRTRLVQPAFWLEEPAFWANAASNTFTAPVNERDRPTNDRLAKYLAHRIAGIPGDVSSHSQRILLHIGRGDAEATYGALLDLFIALGSEGLASRDRLLQRAGTVLRGEHQAVLQERLQAGIRADDVVPFSRHSMLSKSLTGTTDIVRRVQGPGRAPPDSLARARDRVDSGRLAPPRGRP